MKQIILATIVGFFTIGLVGQSNKVSIQKDGTGMKLIVDGKPMMVNGVNWDYVPIGNGILDPGIWADTDDVIMAALDAEMALIKNMGGNAIRTYNIKPKWIKYIYEKHGIYTMLNITFGAYGLTINGAWVPQTDYADPATREVLMNEATTMANTYNGTPGLLLYMIGNENNYHLSWTSAETEDIPIDGAQDPNKIKAAQALYKALNDATKLVKEIDPHHPVAICNGDLLYLDVVKEQCTDIDIYGTNMYRGVAFGDAFQRVKDELDLPILFAEFGADAFNARDNKEDQYTQAYYDVGNWKDIYQNAAGMGLAGNSIGGFTFQFSDGWWKYKQTEDFDVHNSTATWSNNGYPRDQAKPGDNNMNEEWFGICAKGPTNSRGLYDLYPRAAYYAIQQAHQLEPYAEGMSLDFLNNYFSNINLMDAVLRARGDNAALNAARGGKVRLSRLRAEFSTFHTGGDLITTPETPEPNGDTFPNQLGNDHMQSYYVGVEAQPSSNMRAEVTANIIGNVAQNPINEIFYENVGRPITVEGANGEEITITDNNRVRIYQAEFDWQTEQADVRGFYRTGHYHWGYEGDFFGFYPEANYGPNLDIYNGEIFGFEFDGKKDLKGFKAAFGPQLWWGANPGFLAKYQKRIAKWNVTGIYHQDLETQLQLDDNGRRELDPERVRSGVIQPWPIQRASLVLERDFGKIGLTLGGMWGGRPLNGTSYQDFTGDNPDNYIVYEDKINSDDNWGGKAKITYQGGRFNWYAQGGVMGLVANGGMDQTRTFTGWRLKDNGSGNQSNFLSGFTYTIGNWQIAPNFLWQKPLVDPMPNDIGGVGRLRNWIDDPFAVRGNRETTAGEILFTFDPTPGTWFYEWNNDRAEDAKIAFNLGFVFWHLPTAQDAHIGFNENRNFFAFGQSAPAQDLWEINSRIVSKVGPELGLVANIYGGTAQGNGDSDRTIDRFGADAKVLFKNWKFEGAIKVNDWGPYDYHRDFNLTFPVQNMLDISYSLSKPDWFLLPDTRIGIRGIWRSLDEFSPRFGPNAVPPNTFNDPPRLSPVGFDDGQEWEIRTYIHINIGK